MDVEEEEEEVIPDSDPEDDAPILAGRKGGVNSDRMKNKVVKRRFCSFVELGKTEPCRSHI